MIEKIEVEAITVGLFFLWLLVWLTWLPALACLGMAVFFNELYSYQYRFYQWTKKKFENDV